MPRTESVSLARSAQGGCGVVTVVHNSQSAQNMGGNRLMENEGGSMHANCAWKTAELPLVGIQVSDFDAKKSFGTLK